MSRTRKRAGAQSPIKKYVSFSGSTGMLSYWDKAKEENVEFPSLDIIVLDVRSSITGFDESRQGSIVSNMVLDTKTEEMKVVSFAKGKPQNIAQGLYADIKSDVKDAGGKFTSNVLCLAKFDGEWELTNVQLSGAALNSWIEFVKEHPSDGYYDYVITLSKGDLCKRGKKGNVKVTPKEEKALDAKLAKNPRAPRPVWFYVVAIDYEELTEEEADLAVEQDELLQSYFDEASDKKSEDEDGAEEPRESSTVTSPEPARRVVEEGDEEEDEDFEDDLPF